MTDLKAAAKAYINRIGLAVPPHDVHEGFLAHARHMLGNPDRARLFDRAARRSGISHRYSFLPIGSDILTSVDAVRFYEHGNFPTTARRMERYAPDALTLAGQAIDGYGDSPDLASAELGRRWLDVSADAVAASLVAFQRESGGPVG